jgi:hypothetical protein
MVEEQYEQSFVWKRVDFEDVNAGEHVETKNKARD